MGSPKDTGNQHGKNDRQADKQVLLKIYYSTATNCCIIPNYSSKEESKKERKGEEETTIQITKEANSPRTSFTINGTKKKYMCTYAPIQNDDFVRVMVGGKEESLGS